ncbi:MAG: FKBP-type peptidyl-prolyl cis-trans isomerase [Verrucomicrobiota bacterium]
MKPMLPSLTRAALALCLALPFAITAAPAAEPAPGLFTEEEMSEMVTTDTGLKYVDVKVGEGEAVQKGDKLKMHYTGKLIENGQKFDSSKDRGQPFPYQHQISGVIEGWKQGVDGMKVGGVRKLWIPYRLGYGARGAGGAIPPNADLFFEIEILEKTN